MGINLGNFLSSKSKNKRMMEFQDLDHINGVSISTVCANLYDNNRDDLVMFYFRDGANYASVYTQSKIDEKNVVDYDNLRASSDTRAVRVVTTLLSRLPTYGLPRKEKLCAPRFGCAKRAGGRGQRLQGGRLWPDARDGQRQVHAGEPLQVPRALDGARGGRGGLGRAGRRPRPDRRGGRAARAAGGLSRRAARRLPLGRGARPGAGDDADGAQLPLGHAAARQKLPQRQHGPARDAARLLRRLRPEHSALHHVRRGARPDGAALAGVLLPPQRLARAAAAARADGVRRLHGRADRRVVQDDRRARRDGAVVRADRVPRDRSAGQVARDRLVDRRDLLRHPQLG